MNIEKEELFEDLKNLHNKHLNQMKPTDFLDGLYGFISWSLLFVHELSPEKTMEFLKECHDQTEEKLKTLEIE